MKRFCEGLGVIFECLTKPFKNSMKNVLYIMHIQELGNLGKAPYQFNISSLSDRLRANLKNDL